MPLPTISTPGRAAERAPAQGEVELGVEIATQRHLHHRDVGVREHH